MSHVVCAGARKKKASANRVMKPQGRLRKPARAMRRLKPIKVVPAPAANGKTKPALKPNTGLSSLAAELQALHRQCVWHMRTRILLANRLRATVATALGYHAGMRQADRPKLWKKAAVLIDRIKAGWAHPTLTDIVLTAVPSIELAKIHQVGLEKKMVEIAKQLPVAQWAERQRGLGLLALAKIIGETGDLSGYANPAKVWRRMGCAPFAHEGQNAMGATWRRGKEGKLPAEAWEAFGYSPRRRALMYVISESLLKLNHGPYRKRYDEGKAAFRERHPEYTPLRCHLHGMLLMAKRLLRDLWVEWNKASTSKPVIPSARVSIASWVGDEELGTEPKAADPVSKATRTRPREQRANGCAGGSAPDGRAARG